MDDCHKLTEVEILDTFESLRKEIIEGLSKLPESGQNEAVRLNTSERISTGSTELICEREVYFTTSQQNCIKKFNSMSDFPNASSSLKAEDTDYHKASVHKYDIREVDDIFKNELDKVDPLILPDTKPASIINVNMVEQSVVCKSEAMEGEDLFNLEENKFELEGKKMSFMKREYLKEEEVVKYKDEDIPTFKTEEWNEVNLTDMDLNYSVKDEDTNSRKEEGHLVILDLTRNSDKRSDITGAVEIVGRDLKTQYVNEISLRKSAAHECPQCNKRFSENGHLKRHLRIHEGIRPYECSRCNKRFSQKEHLKSHMRCHEGIRPYECPQCNMRFTKSGNLNKRFSQKGHFNARFAQRALNFKEALNQVNATLAH